MKFIALLLLIPLISLSQPIDSSTALASQYFKEARKMSERDNGKLWGRKMYGPMIFVDKNTGLAIANEPDSAGVFKKIDGVFLGKVPGSFASNTAKRWGSKIWTVMLWPIPKDRYDRAYLMMHELFHQLQQRTGLPTYNAMCDHLDAFEGRLLLKLELEAFRKLINEYPSISKNDLENAVSLRKLRYQKFPLADSLEHSLELNEGLATFTGFILSGRNLEQQKKTINKQIDEFYQNETFVRSLGYITGYVYGFLLSHKDSKWNRTMGETRASFEELLIRSYKIKLKSSAEQVFNTIAKAGAYNYDAVYAYEKQREEKRIAIVAENKRKFIDGPVLELPNEQMSFNFNPNEVQVLEGYGPVYPTFTGKAAWGLLEVKKGGALVKDWMRVYVPLPENFNKDSKNIKMDDWQLDLKEGWKITEGSKKGNYKVVKE